MWTSAILVYILVTRPHHVLTPWAHLNVHVIKAIPEMDINVYQRVSTQCFAQPVVKIQAQLYNINFTNVFIVTVPLTGCHGKECHEHGYCDRSGNVPVCRCKSGFRGDGGLCEGNPILRNNPC